MNKHFQNIILKSTGARGLYEVEEIQSLWSGYGKIMRYGLEDSDIETVVVKHVKMPNRINHPRGWDTGLSHKRKLKSYQVEMAWYREYAKECDESCRIPACYALETQGDEVLMVLEDLNTAGYPGRKNRLNWKEMQVCLSWLANFHAVFMNRQPENLWKKGTYWHLDTRPDEFKVLTDGLLKKAAGRIDNELHQSPFKTFVHGDAKLANFCFSPDGKKAAAVDFQYVGGGCGMKDVAYFVGSCLDEDESESYENDILEYYFKVLKEALQKHNSVLDVEALEENWRALYPVAWTDFHRFLKGWSPGHWKINSYSERVAREVVGKLKVK